MTRSTDSDATEPETYNKVFEFYAEDSEDEIDLVGFTAYALYKRQKRDWILKCMADKERRPSKDEVAAVITNYLTEDMRRTLRERAKDLLSQYADTYVEAAAPGITTDALNTEMARQAETARSDIKKTEAAIHSLIEKSSSPWRQIWVGVTSAFAWTAILAVVLIGAKLFGVDPIDGWLSLNTATEQH